MNKNQYGFLRAYKSNVSKKLFCAEVDPPWLIYTQKSMLIMKLSQILIYALIYSPTLHNH